jgi:phosphopantothenoylcysteine decarboxylase/phosphopantothenate--cysteine ligase
MSSYAAGKNILFGMTGSIAVCKAAGWVSSLTKEEARVTVVLTEAAARFVTPLTLAAISGNKVYGDMFEPENAEHIPHISLARECDLYVIAPATAHTIACLAHGQADSLVAALSLATPGRVIIFPAMNSRMYTHPATRKNLTTLREYGYTIVEPCCGPLACGDEGPGRLVEWDEAREAILAALAPQDLAGQQVVVTAGPTREPLDPVRYIGNPSSGKMGYELARTARRRGASVTLISGPTWLDDPPGVHVIRINTAREMYEQVMGQAKVDIIVMAAAVSDFRPVDISEHKVKKGDAPAEIRLERNPDILKELGESRKQGYKPFLVGFAAESHDHLEEGRRKLQEKNLDMIVINDILGETTGFAAPTNKVTLLDSNESSEELPLLSKEETADRIWDRVVEMISDQ